MIMIIMFHFNRCCYKMRDARVHKGVKAYESLMFLGARAGSVCERAGAHALAVKPVTMH